MRVEAVGEVTEMEGRLVELVEDERHFPTTTQSVGCKGRNTIERTGRSCCRGETGVEGEERSTPRVTSV